MGPSYRRDIDGLRAIAVISVILFHSGWAPYGYLGVDVFFVISGYLITGIILQDIANGRFSLIYFYERRIRRILPLVTFTSAVAGIIGFFVMLPDDFENLCQSIIATSFFGNNILQALTTQDYWDVVNEFKPLMHTWSLAVEEQYYFLYPLIFLLFGKRRKALCLGIIVFLALVSFLFWSFEDAEYKKFYFLQYRFFEIAAGGILAFVTKKKVLNFRHAWIFLVLLLLTLTLPEFSEKIRLLLCVSSTIAILLCNNGNSLISKTILLNVVSVAIGLVSFSLYMWHQIVFSYARYFIFEEVMNWHYVILIFVTGILSVLSYYFIEKPFRNKRFLSFRFTVVGLLICGTFLNGAAFYFYLRSGIVRDVPELGISADNQSPFDQKKSLRKIHSRYNHNIHNLNVSFAESEQNLINVLVVGNSFARDWANVLLESKYVNELRISYRANFDPTALERALKANIIFIFGGVKDDYLKAGISLEKIWAVGTKNFGNSNGYFYNYRGHDYCLQRVRPGQEWLLQNQTLMEEFTPRFVDLFSVIMDSDGKVPVFTDDCQFISQDCRHLTKAGAQFFAEKLDQQLNVIFSSDRKDF